VVVRDDVVTQNPDPRVILGRRALDAREEPDHLMAYEPARGPVTAARTCVQVYSSQITEWRKLRDTGLLTGKKLGQKIVGHRRTRWRPPG
jgi:hypothetical protein